MRRNKMGKNILIELADENGEIVDFKYIIVSNPDFEKRFHENFHDVIRTYAGRAESEQLKHYKIIMEVEQR